MLTNQTCIMKIGLETCSKLPIWGKLASLLVMLKDLIFMNTIQIMPTEIIISRKKQAGKPKSVCWKQSGKIVSISFMLKILSFQAYELDNAYLHDKKTCKFVGNLKCVCARAHCKQARKLPGTYYKIVVSPHKLITLDNEITFKMIANSYFQA